jgi:hypothetical protein
MLKVYPFDVTKSKSESRFVRLSLLAAFKVKLSPSAYRLLITLLRDLEDGALLQKQFTIGRLAGRASLSVKATSEALLEMTKQGMIFCKADKSLVDFFDVGFRPEYVIEIYAPGEEEKTKAETKGQ